MTHTTIFLVKKFVAFSTKELGILWKILLSFLCHKIEELYKQPKALITY
jgi:hypothetical protein